MPGDEVAPIDDQLGRGAGVLLAAAGTADVIDAALVLLAQDGDEIMTSDPADLVDLAMHPGRHVDLLPV